jgi:hypothetical protein
MATDRGYFPMHDSCPECELTNARHEPWCSAAEPPPSPPPTPGPTRPPSPKASPR